MIFIGQLFSYREVEHLADMSRMYIQRYIPLASVLPVSTLSSILPLTLVSCPAYTTLPTMSVISMFIGSLLLYPIFPANVKTPLLGLGTMVRVGISDEVLPTLRLPITIRNEAKEVT